MATPLPALVAPQHAAGRRPNRMLLAFDPWTVSRQGTGARAVLAAERAAEETIRVRSG